MKISLMEMDARIRESMSLVLRHRTKGAITMVDAGNADIVVLDLDREEALARYKSLRAARPALRAIGLSSTPAREQQEILVLRKPISAGSLLDAIEKLSGAAPAATGTSAAAMSLGARTAGARRRIEAAAGVGQDKMQFDPKFFLVGCILEAAAEARRRDLVAVISFYGDRVILVDSTRGVIQTNLSSSQARAFAFVSMEEVAAADSTGAPRLKRPVIEYATRAVADSRYGESIVTVAQEVFMWQMGVATSRGRLPVDLPVDERICLRRWPNMTRFSHSDNDMRIIAYWLRQACSVSEISQALNIAEQEVCSVFSAAFAAGIAIKARREVDEIWEAPAVAVHQERGLLSSIMKRLLKRRPADGQEHQAVAA